MHNGNLQALIEDYQTVRKTVRSFTITLHPLLYANSARWEPGSVASLEAASFPDSEAVSTAYSQAFIAIVVAMDHMAAIDRLLTAPVTTFAPWTALRVVLESCCTALFLLERVEVKERITRGMALECKHLQDGQTFLDEVSRNAAVQQDRIRDTDLFIKTELCALAKTAENNNIELKYARRKLIVGKGVPNMVDLSGKTLRAAWMYRLLSGVAHGRSWAQVLGLGHVEDVKALTQELDPEMAAIVLRHAIVWVSRAIWAYFDLAGWDLDHLERVLEDHFVQAGLAPSESFWRK